MYIYIYVCVCVCACVCVCVCVCGGVINYLGNDEVVELIINLIKTNLIRFFLGNSVEPFTNLKIFSMRNAYLFS
jgi:hypothetical protein